MSAPKILITRPDIPDEGIDLLFEAGYDIEIWELEKPIPKSDMLTLIAGKDGLLCNITDTVDEDVITAAGDKLRVIATMSAEYDHIDTILCKHKNIVVCNTPDVAAESIAEWMVLLMIAAGRLFVKSATAIVQEKWLYSWGPVWLCGDGLTNKVVGIVGMGHTGRAILNRILPFGVKQVLYYDAFHPIKAVERLGAIYTELEDLLKTSDYVVCMINLTDETRNLFCMKTFQLMKTSAVFVNGSRGEVVNQNDLYETLQTKAIKGAALDVTLPQPLPKDHSLLTLDNIIITPHLGCSEASVRVKIAELAIHNIFNVLQGQPAVSPVTIIEKSSARYFKRNK